MSPVRPWGMESPAIDGGRKERGGKYLATCRGQVGVLAGKGQGE
jgi:hypothetical protein